MTNTAEEVTMPRDLAHRVKNILMALESAWKDNPSKYDEVKRITAEFVGAEFYLSRPGTLEDLRWANTLIPGQHSAATIELGL